MKLKYILVSIISSLLFTIFIYNLQFDSRILRYTFISIFYFLLYLFLSSKSIYKNSILIFLLTIITPILIDSSVIFTYPEMIPLRFPFSSIFPVIGALTGQIIVSKMYKTLMLFIPAIIIFFYISYIYLIPQLLFQITLKNEHKINYQSILKETFLDAVGIKHKLLDICNKKCNLIECYFVGCPPCMQKDFEIEKLDSVINDKSFTIIRICSGVATDYDTFKKSIIGKKGIYLYDNDSVLYKKYTILGYPFELIADKDKIRGSINGFNKSTSQIYFNNEIKTIKTILNE